MPFSDLMNDTIDIIKKDGERLSGLKASVQKSHVFMDAGRVLVETGDVIVRKMSNGAEEAYEVIDPGFHEGLSGIPPNYQMTIRRGLAPTGLGSNALRRPVSGERTPQSVMRIFISHSSSDAGLGEALVELLRTALNLGSKDIRCTSVNGYKLPAGAESDQQLRNEVFGCDAFLAVLSPKSMKSMYVMFEMGARWGAHRYLVPILVKGTKAGDLKAPLSAIHAINGQSEAEVHQLLGDVGKRLSLEVEPSASYGKALKGFLEQSVDEWI